MRERYDFVVRGIHDHGKIRHASSIKPWLRAVAAPYHRLFAAGAGGDVDDKPRSQLASADVSAFWRSAVHDSVIDRIPHYGVTNGCANERGWTHDAAAT